VAVSEPALRFDHASLAYGRVRVVEDVHGTVHSGQAVALIGPNGAGKSTLLRAVLGLVDVVAGRIEVLGKPPARARREVAYVPQVDTLDPQFPVSVGQVVLMGRYRDVGWLRRPGAADRVSTHDLALAHLACDEVCLLNKHQVAFGPTDATLTPELLRSAYGGQALELGDDSVIVAR
jgi:manganese/iron transport system ATP-binding protein